MIERFALQTQLPPPTGLRTVRFDGIAALWQRDQRMLSKRVEDQFQRRPV